MKHTCGLIYSPDNSNGPATRKSKPNNREETGFFISFCAAPLFVTCHFGLTTLPLVGSIIADRCLLYRGPGHLRVDAIRVPPLQLRRPLYPSPGNRQKSIYHIAVCLALVSFGLPQCPVARAQAPTSGPTGGPSVDQMTLAIHERFWALGEELGLSADEKAKVDNFEKKIAEQSKADPSKVHAKDFEEASMKQFRELLSPEHQKKFDEVMKDQMEQSRRINSTASHLRQVGLAEVLYSSENDGKLAPDLGTLATAVENSAVDNYLMADSKNHVPADWYKMDAKAQLDWVNKNSDFVYLGGSIKSNPDAAVVLAYVKPELAPNGNAFLMADGRVLEESAAESKAIIADLKAGTNPPLSMKVKPGE